MRASIIRITIPCGRKHNVIVKKGSEMTRNEWPSPEVPVELQKILAEEK